MTSRTASPLASPAYRAGAAALLLALGAIIAAHGFERFGGYLPCPLCLQQRYAYYLGIPLLFAALALLAGRHPRWAAALFALAALGFLANAGLASYHTGVEWKFWAGPESCATAIQPLSSSGGILKDLPSTRVVRCDAAPWHFLGLSFAGWNVVVSLVLGLAALQAAVQARHA